MVNIIDIGFGVDKFNQVPIILIISSLVRILTFISVLRPKFFVDPVTANLTKVVSLIGEEQFVDNIACCCLVGWFSVTELTVDIDNCLFFRVTGIFL